ncbi:MAG TPA: tetratricopeptide repeat protein [Thermoplasmata archaeon]|nr:tetratricopeptide repeat protein [Thermoplasmata archaeon]
MRDADLLWESLERRGLLTDARVKAALREVPIAPFVAPPFGSVAPVDAPLATSLTPPHVILPPPRLLVLLLQMLELEGSVSVLLLGTSGGYVEALIAHLVSPAPITVWEEDADLAAASRRALDANGFAGRVTFVAGPPEGRFDRVTTIDQIVRLDTKSKELIADMGFAAYRAMRETPQFQKLLRSGDEYLELGTSDAARAGGPEAGTRHGPREDIGRELILGRMLENAWARREETEHDRQFAGVVDDTFARPNELPPMAAHERERYDAAKVLFHLAYVYQSAGEFEPAIDLYRASVAVRPTAEAHTFLGWVLSFQGRYEDAIRECERAIAVDPAFGNPYNDIGAYLIEMGRPDDAIPWFEKAKRSTRYCCYFYPFANLGRVYMMKGMQEKARKEFEQALRINPQYAYAVDMLRRMGRGSDYIA